MSADSLRRRGPLVAVVGAALALGVTACGSVAGVHEAPSQVTTVAPLGGLKAQEITARVLAEAESAAVAPPGQAAVIRRRALTGPALAVAEAAARLGPNPGSPGAPIRKSEPPKVLAVSRGTGWPRVILARTTGADGATRLNLLSSPDARTAFRLAFAATMHPGATVPAIDPLPQGSPLVLDGAGLTVAPDALVRELAAGLAYPRPAATPHVLTTDPFSVAVRANAAAQAKAFGGLATLTRSHQPQAGASVALALHGGGAVVFALLQRTDSITLKPGGRSLTPNAQFQHLVGKRTLTRSAELKTYETVVLTLPPEGKASVVAVDEVLFSAKGA
ncbi:hypothetical protein [Pedococcus sp. 5OH_020]|uniref:hypothetical protein n=1 Tax=Pedococcus sp. 5OH_020 TaxID=2989814 RepID=UPI0022E9BB2B|nr:hypothetical protein [Pedococcus sp. 5OH_020]